MDNFDLDKVLSMLAAIVNRAGRSSDTTAEGVKTVSVPLALLWEAKDLLKPWVETEYTTDEIRNATKRLF